MLNYFTKVQLLVVQIFLEPLFGTFHKDFIWFKNKCAHGFLINQNMAVFTRFTDDYPRAVYFTLFMRKTEELRPAL